MKVYVVVLISSALPMHLMSTQHISSCRNKKKYLSDTPSYLELSRARKWSRLAQCQFCFFVCVEVLQPSQPNGVMGARSVYLITLLLDRLSPLSC